AFLAPFPDLWFEAGASHGGTLMRRVAGLEMIGVYLALAFIPAAVWRWRRRVEVYVILAFCTGMMVLYGVSITNVGALYRLRYGFIMTVAAVGIAAGLRVAEEVYKRRRNAEAGVDRFTAPRSAGRISSARDRNNWE